MAAHSVIVDPNMSIQELGIVESGAISNRLLKFEDDYDAASSTVPPTLSSEKGDRLADKRRLCNRPRRIYRRMAFQHAVSELYGSRCMVTGRWVTLGAIHIIPKNRSDFTKSVLWNRFNGLILCREAQLLFITGHLRVDDKLRLEFSNSVRNSRRHRDLCRHRHLHLPKHLREHAQWFLRWHHSHWGATFRRREMRALERPLRQRP
jgi:predicted restriction endonuclease